MPFFRLCQGVKDIDDLEAKVAARLQPPATSLRDSSVIRTVWRRARVEAEKALTGSVDAPEDWEIPLNPTTKNALTAKSSAAYGTTFRARKMPCDSLLGRIYREREKQSLTAFPLARVRSLANSPQAKERPRPQFLLHLGARPCSWSHKSGVGIFGDMLSIF